MPIMNYTTKVDVFATLGEIQGQLVKHGAKKIMQDYDNDGHITALSFLIDTPNGPRGIRLPANVDTVWAVLTKPVIPLHVMADAVYLEGRHGGDYERLSNFGSVVFLSQEEAKAAASHWLD